ncbi:MAG: hypothetical protein U7123_05615 [Potamolinea sp.]
MDSWEFLLQQEGSRTWQPIKSSKIAIVAGRYRVVAHSSRSNTEVEICVSHESTEEVPPKRRSQKRSRRTNREGLMVVIPFTYLKPGRWELRCCGDIMSDFLLRSWQETVQLQVLPFVEASETEVKADSDIAVEVAPVTEKLSDTAVPVKSEMSGSPDSGLEIVVKEKEKGRVAESEKLQPNTELNQQSHVPLIEVTNLHSIAVEQLSHPKPIQFDSTNNTDNSFPEQITQISPPSPSESLPLPITLEKTSPQQPDESDENNSKLTADLDEQDWGLKMNEGGEISPVSLPVQAKTATNPILEESLQMLDQILQQVLDPLLLDLDPSEASELQIEETSEFEYSLESGGLNLTLEEDALIAVGKTFSITGVVDFLDVLEINGSQTSSTGDLVFSGTLRYELRDPENSKVLLNIQHQLPEQALPLAFSQTIEIPSDCNTRLILGKVTLYGSTPVALASQPFTVTADLAELLGAILAGTKVMPVAKMLVISKELPVSQEVTVEQPEAETLLLNQVVLDLIDTRQSSQSRPLQPVSQHPLPPQIYQPSPTHKPSKSLQLPNFPRIQTTPTVLEAQVVEVKEEDSMEQLVALAKELFPETANSLSSVETSTEEAALDGQNEEVLKLSEEKISEAEAIALEDFSASAWDNAVDDSSLASSDLPENVEAPSLTKDSRLDTLDTLDTSDTTATVVPTTDSQAIESEVSDSPKRSMLEASDGSVVLDNAFPTLNIQNRFWLRLNSLAIDEQFSQWLKSDVSPPNSALVEEVTPSLNLPTVPVEEEEVTPSLNLPTFPMEVEEVRRSALLPRGDTKGERSSASSSVTAGLTLSPDLDTLFAEAQEVTQPPNPDTLFTNFDNSMWEEAEDLGSAFADEHQLQLPVLEEETPTEVEETPDYPPVVEVVQQDWDAQEIVVEDEETLAGEPTFTRREASGKVDAWEMVYPTRELVSKPKPVILPPPQLESPIPAPTIVLPSNELTAGETLTVRIKLPPHRVRLCVKLWLQDRQSRYLLDGPRWLVDLLPDGSGKLEAMTQLVVPFGSVDIRFEAIAVDLDTQRESHKVALDCVVVPSDLVKFGLDEFDA